MGSGGVLQAVSQKAKESEFVPLSRLAGQFREREPDRGIGEDEVLRHVVEAERLEDAEDGLLKIRNCYAVRREVALQVDGDALSDMFRQPPAAVTRVFRSVADGGCNPAFVEGGVPAVGERHKGHAVTECDHRGEAFSWFF